MSRTWIFQASPDRWDARRGLAALDVVEYKVARHAKDIKSDDRVYFWISGSGGGLYARGTVLDEPSDRVWNADGYEIDQEPEGTRCAVSIAINDVLSEPVPRDAVRDDERLTNLSLLRQPQGTNFAVTPDEAIVVDELFAAFLSVRGEFSWSLSVAATTVAIDDSPPSPIKESEFRAGVAERVSTALDVQLRKDGRSAFLSPDRDTVVVTFVSKHYTSPAECFWFGVHPPQKERLEGAEQAFLAFGCGTPDLAFLVPFAEFQPWLDGLNRTENERGGYWHVRIEPSLTGYTLRQRKGFEPIPVDGFRIR